MVATATIKTGIARICAILSGPPCTAAAAATTRLPVTWAVKIWPRVKNPVRSTIPAMTVSGGGKRASSRDSCASSATSVPIPIAAAPLASLDMSSRSHDPSLYRSVAEMVDDQLRNDEPQAHRQNDGRGGHAVGDCPVDQRQRRLRAGGGFDKPAQHPEEVDAGDHRHDGREANRCERHMGAA